MDIARIEQVIALLNEYPVSEITVEQAGQRVSVRKALISTPLPAVVSLAESSPPPAEEASVVTESEAILIEAPMVGVFYHAAPPLRPDGHVRAGQVVGSIESMRVMNDVTAAQEGQVAEVLIEDSGAVEYGQVLFRLVSEAS